MPEMVYYYNSSSYYFHEDDGGEGTKYYKKLLLAYQNLLIKKNTKDSTKISIAFEKMKKLFVSDTSKVNNVSNMYWLTDIDFFNIYLFTNGFIGALCVKEFNDPSDNDRDNFIQDWGFRSYCNEPILQKYKYFMIIRHVEFEHYDIFYDQMRGTYLFSTKDIFDETSAISIILKLMSPKQKYDLTEINPKKTWDQVFHLSKK